MKRRTRDNLKGWGILTPVFIYYIIFTVVPVFFMFGLSLTDYGEVMKRGDFVVSFVGLRNFAYIFQYPEYLKSFLSTFIIAFFIVGVGMVMGFFVALCLKSVKRGKTFYRAIWYIPALLSGAIVSQFVNALIASDGMINKILEIFHLDPILWNLSSFWMFFWIIAIVSWQGLGGTALLFLAGLNGISNDVYEAATIDGANSRQRMWYITLPLLKPMTGFILITGFMGAFNIFEPVKLISQGGPDQATKVILYRIYDEAFANFKYGFACALSVVTFAFILGCTLINLKISDNGLFGYKRSEKNV